MTRDRRLSREITNEFLARIAVRNGRSSPPERRRQRGSRLVSFAVGVGIALSLVGIYAIAGWFWTGWTFGLSVAASIGGDRS